MKITQVEYRRLVSLEEYSNVTVGATAEVGDDESASVALNNLRAWVEGHIAELSEAHRKLDDVMREWRDKQFELRHIERNIEKARERKVKAEAWLARQGLPLPSGWNTDDMPF